MNSFEKRNLIMSGALGWIVATTSYLNGFSAKEAEGVKSALSISETIYGARNVIIVKDENINDYSNLYLYIFRVSFDVK